MTKIIDATKSQGEDVKKEIEFIHYIGSDINNKKPSSYPDIWDKIELIQRKGKYKYDLMFAYEDNERRHGCLYLGKFNDGVTSNPKTKVIDLTQGEEKKDDKKPIEFVGLFCTDLSINNTIFKEPFKLKEIKRIFAKGNSDYKYDIFECITNLDNKIIYYGHFNDGVI